MIFRMSQDHMFGVCLEMYVTDVKWFNTNNPAVSPQQHTRNGQHNWGPKKMMFHNLIYFSHCGVFSNCMGCGYGGIACDTLWPGSFVKPLSFSVNCILTSSFTQKIFPLSNVCVGIALKKVCFGVFKRHSNLCLVETWLHPFASWI